METKSKIRVSRTAAIIDCSTTYVRDHLDLDLNPEIVVGADGRRYRYYDEQTVREFAAARREKLARIEVKKHEADPYHFERCALRQAKRTVKRGRRG